MKDFIEVVSNVSRDSEGLYRGPIAREIIPVENLKKIYRYFDSEGDWAIAYVFDRNGNGAITEFHEYLSEWEFKHKWEYLLNILTGRKTPVKFPLWCKEDKDNERTLIRAWPDSRLSEVEDA